jgi:hypothetical protein
MLVSTARLHDLCTATTGVQNLEQGAHREGSAADFIVLAGSLFGGSPRGRADDAEQFIVQDTVE